MAEAALTSIAKSALQLFTSLAKDEFLLQWKSQKELEMLEDTIETVRCFLQDADKLQSKELSVQNCLARLRKVMYEADDFLDALAWQAMHEKTITGNTFKKEVHLWFSKLSKFKIAHEVKAIRESLECIKADMVTFGFISQSRPIGHQGVMRFDRDKTHSFVHKEDVIGRDQEREDIVNLLLLPKGDTSDDRSFSVVVVIGFGGLGKTTLAQLVYNDERVTQGFDVCLWACVNDLSNLEQVLIEIIASREGRLSHLGLEKLQEKLREMIGGRKFLVVLDDVWDEDSSHWRRLETILRCGSIGSKALVTTRSQKVADSLDVSKPCGGYLGGLSDESAWFLFVKKAFRREGLNEHPELEPIGRKIVSSCGNVPLAIVVVGSLLRQREKEEKVWSHFLENELREALSKSDKDGSQNSVKDVLMVSYNDLLPQLKLCFAYCSLFPKGHRFKMNKLVRLWLAQGFVKSSANSKQSLEEVGEDYFFHLVERCFFQEVNQNGYKITAKMHDLLHDVAIDVSKTDVILFDKDSINERNMNSLRHFSIDFKVVGSLDYCNLVSNPNTVRTLLHYSTFFATNSQISQGSLDMLVTSFKMLRTLSLPNRGIINVSNSIGELIHLRYLDLSENTALKHLPKSICRLHNLMTLALRCCESLEKLPPKIGKLVSLRQLYIDRCDRLDCLPRGLTALTSLVNLDRMIVHPQSGGLGYLENLDNLRGVLRIELPKEGWPSAVEDAKRSNMSKKLKLDGLEIEWTTKGSNNAQTMGKDDAEQVVEALEPHQGLQYLRIKSYGGEKLPGWFCTLKNVKKINLISCERLTCLQEGWVRHLNALQSLNIFACRGLQRVSRRGLSHLTTLKELVVLGSDDCQIGDEEEDDGDVNVGMPWKALRGLEKLSFSVGDMHLHEGLAYLSCLEDLNIKKWKDIQLGDGDTGGVQLPSKALQNLCRLDIGFEEEANIICHLSKVGIQNLRSLKTLSITGCKELYLGWKTLLFSMKLEHLFLDGVGDVINVEDRLVVEPPTQLGLLSVWDCKELKWVHHIPWRSLTSLTLLILGELREMEELPDGIQHVTSLRALHITGCEKVRSVPTWLPHLTSLQSLMFWDCSAELERRCEEWGEDWLSFATSMIEISGQVLRMKKRNK